MTVKELRTSADYAFKIAEKRDALYALYLERHENLGWKCKQCLTLFKQKGHLTDHVEAAHLTNIEYFCPYGCGQTGRTRKAIRYHVGQSHRHELATKLDWSNVEFRIYE